MADGVRTQDLGSVSLADDLIVNRSGSTGRVSFVNLSAQLGDTLFISADDTSADLVGAADAADPDGRDTFAPALVSSMQARRLYGVTMRDLLGRSYNPANDGAGALSGFIAELAPAGIAIRDPDNLTVLCGEPIKVVSGMKLFLGPQSTLKRGYADASTDDGALFSHADYSVDLDDFIIDGGIITTASASQTGKFFSIYGDNWQVRNTKFLEFYGGQAMVFGGNNVRIHNTYANTADTTSGTGVYRMLGGTGFRGTAMYGEGGDDVFQFVPSTNPANARYNQDIIDSYYIGGYGISHSARVLIAAIAGPQNTYAMTCKLRSVGFIGMGGKGGNRSMVVENSEGDGTVKHQIDDVLFSACSMDETDEDGTTSQSINVLSDRSGAVPIDDGIGRVTFRDVKLKANPRIYGATIGAVGSTVLFDNCDIEGESSALNIITPGASVVKINGGRLAVVDNNASGTGNWVVELTSASDAVELEVTGTPLFDGVYTAKAALRSSSATGIIRAGDIKVGRLGAATTVYGVSHATGANVRLGRVLGDFDTDETGSGEIQRNVAVWLGSTQTIASGSVTLNAPSCKIDTESSAASDDLDTVVFPSWATNGQMFVIRAADNSRTVVIKDATGNIKANGDFSLTHSEDVFVGMKNGTLLIEISRSDNTA